MQIVTMEDIDNGVSSIIAGTNVTVSPPSGTGDVTVSASGGGGGATPIQTAVIALSSVQLRALDLTPITVIPAPGTGKAILLASTSLQSKGSHYAIPTTGVAISLFYNNRAQGNQIVSYLDGPGGVSALFTGTVDGFTFNSVPVVANAGWNNGQIETQVNLPSVSINQPVILEIAPQSWVANIIGTFNAGPITTMTVANGGAGYAPGDTFTIDAGGAFGLDTNDATGHVVTAPGGVVATVAINTPGFSYAITTANPQSGPYPTAHTSGVGNDALTVNVTGATISSGTGQLTINYNIIPLL